MSTVLVDSNTALKLVNNPQKQLSNVGVKFLLLQYFIEAADVEGSWLGIFLVQLEIFIEKYMHYSVCYGDRVVQRSEDVVCE